MRIKSTKIDLEALPRSIIRNLRQHIGKTIAGEVLGTTSPGGIVQLRFVGGVFEARLDGLSLRAGQILTLFVTEDRSGRLKMRITSRDTPDEIKHKPQAPIKIGMPSETPGNSIVNAFTRAAIKMTVERQQDHGDKKKTTRASLSELLEKAGLVMAGSLEIQGLISPADNGDEDSKFSMVSGEIEKHSVIVLKIPTKHLGIIGALITNKQRETERSDELSISLWSESEQVCSLLELELENWNGVLREFIPTLSNIRVLKRDDLKEIDRVREWIS